MKGHRGNQDYTFSEIRLLPLPALPLLRFSIRDLLSRILALISPQSRVTLNFAESHYLRERSSSL